MTKNHLPLPLSALRREREEMPIYSFSCSSHEHTFEEIVSMNTETTTCPTCGQPAERTYIDVPARRNPDLGIQR